MCVSPCVTEGDVVGVGMGPCQGHSQCVYKYTPGNLGSDLTETQRDTHTNRERERRGWRKGGEEQGEGTGEEDEETENFS